MNYPITERNKCKKKLKYREEALLKISISREIFYKRDTTDWSS